MEDRSSEMSPQVVRPWPSVAILTVYSSVALLGTVISAPFSWDLRNPFDISMAHMFATFVIPLWVAVYGVARKRWWTVTLHTVLVVSWVPILMTLAYATGGHDLAITILAIGMGALLTIMHMYLWTNRAILFHVEHVSKRQLIIAWVLPIAYMISMVVVLLLTPDFD